MRQNLPPKRGQEGQALVEFTLALPVLLLIMLAAYFVGAAMYTGANASSALRAALQRKSDYADSESAMANFKAEVNSFNSGTFRIPGSVVDSVSLQNTDRQTAVIVAQKTVDFPLFPTFNFVVTQGIKSSLITNNKGASNTYTFVPYDAKFPQKSSTLNPKSFQFDSNVPLFVPIDANCTPDLSVFDQADMVDTCDGACRAANTQSLYDAHKQHVDALGGCSGNGFSNTSDTTFNSGTPKY